MLFVVGWACMLHTCVLCGFVWFDFVMLFGGCVKACTWCVCSFVTGRCVMWSLCSLVVGYLLCTWSFGFPTCVVIVRCLVGGDWRVVGF